MSDPQKLASATVEALQNRQASVGVWGCGHIGASAMYHFSQKGVRCVGYDITRTRVREIRQGRFLSTDAVPDGRLEGDVENVTATTDWRELKNHRIAVHIIAVPTERGTDPSSAALEDIMPLICEVIRETRLDGIIPTISIESTIQPSWIDSVVLPQLHASGLRPDVDVLIGAAPRRDWFSNKEHNLESLPRVVGGSSAAASAVLSAFYGLVCREVVVARDAYHAAFTKVIENLMRFQGLALANSLSLAFPQYDMTHVLGLASTKWNIPYYHPSMGIGGHCIPLAPRYALEEAGSINPYMEPVRQAVTFNHGYFSRLYQERLRELLRDCRSIVILGLAYTPDAKMHKLSAALDALQVLKNTPRLRLHDPYYSADDIEDICSVATLSFPEDLQDCDGIILVTAHQAYRTAEVEQFVRPGTVIVDNFGAWRDKRFQQGVRYYEIGRLNDGESASGVLQAEPTSTIVS